MSARRRIIPVFVPHAGCGHACVFCNQRLVSEGEPNRETLGLEIENALLRAGEGSAPELAYYGGSFTAIPDERRLFYLETARGFINEGKISSFRVSTRPDAVPEERLSELLEYGDCRIELGVQSMDNRVLELSRRGHTAEDTVLAAGRILEKRIPLVLQMMVGLPGESATSPYETAKRIAELSPEAVRIFPAVVLEGTELLRLWRLGEYRALTAEEASEVCAGLIEIFDAADIPVIRIGLQPTDRLSEGGVVAGAYHPALGEMARSRLYLNRAREALMKAEIRESAVLYTEPRAISLLVGRKRENIDKLKVEFGISRLYVRGADLESGVVLAEGSDKIRCFGKAQ